MFQYVSLLSENQKVPVEGSHVANAAAGLSHTQIIPLYCIHILPLSELLCKLVLSCKGPGRQTKMWSKSDEKEQTQIWHWNQVPVPLIIRREVSVGCT